MNVEKPRVSVIVPVWNRADLTQTFLRQHWQMIRDRGDVETIVVDNGSTDLTPVVLERWAKVYGNGLVVARHAENKGFAAGHNAGYAVARGDILIFVSNDVVIKGDYVGKMVAKLDAADRPVLLGAEMHTTDTGWNVFRGVMHGDGQKRWDEPEIIPYLAGHLIAAKRGVWDMLGGWDERYTPADYEDIDLSYNAITQGIGLVAIPLPVEHLFGQSAANLPGGRIEHTRRSQRLFMEKWELVKP